MRHCVGLSQGWVQGLYLEKFLKPETSLSLSQSTNFRDPSEDRVEAGPVSLVPDSRPKILGIHGDKSVFCLLVSDMVAESTGVGAGWSVQVTIWDVWLVSESQTRPMHLGLHTLPSSLGPLLPLRVPGFSSWNLYSDCWGLVTKDVWTWQVRVGPAAPRLQRALGRPHVE